MLVGASGPLGLSAYAAILFEPRFRATLINTVVLAAAAAALAPAAPHIILRESRRGVRCAVGPEGGWFVGTGCSP